MPSRLRISAIAAPSFMVVPHPFRDLLGIAAPVAMMQLRLLRCSLHANMTSPKRVHPQKTEQHAALQDNRLGEGMVALPIRLSCLRYCTDHPRKFADRSYARC